MFHVLSWGIPYALLMTGSPVVFTNNFTDSGEPVLGKNNGWGSASHLCFQKYQMDGFWSNYSDLTRPGPQKVAKEGTSPYFRKIQVGETL